MTAAVVSALAGLPFAGLPFAGLPFAGLPFATAPSPGPVVSTSTPAVPAVSDTGVGLLGFLIVCALLVVCVGLFFAMRGSLRRLRDNENGGTFATDGDAGQPPVQHGR